MSVTDKVQTHLLRYGYISWDRIAAFAVKNPPAQIYKLRSKGLNIESVWQEKNGKRHVVGYRYYSNARR